MSVTHLLALIYHNKWLVYTSGSQMLKLILIQDLGIANATKFHAFMSGLSLHKGYTGLH